MIRAALTAMLALSGSILLHGAGLLALSETPSEPLAGGMGSAPPLLGDSFADLAQGMAEAVAATQVHAASRPDALTPVTSGAAKVVPLAPEGLAPVSAKEAAATEQAEAIAAIRPQPTAPVQQEAARQTAPAPVLKAAPEPLAFTETPSPRQKPKPRPEQKDAPKEVAKDRAKPPAAKGGETAARKGSTGGSTTAKATTAQGQKAKAESAGAAASASYGNAVMRKISRTRKKSTSLRGTAVVSFSVGANGQLANVSIARSSGHAELDRLGLDHIRRAAPFPAPPQGANTRFSVEFTGR